MASSQTIQNILSFSNPLDKEEIVEAAGIFYLSEMERNKGDSLFSRQLPETLIFISKIAYPLWLIPNEKSTLVFDGLAENSHKLSYLVYPPSNTFYENMEANREPRERYNAFLSKQCNYLKQPLQERTINLKGLMTEAAFKSDLNKYIMEVTQLSNFEVFLKSLLSEIDIDYSLKELNTLRSQLDQDKNKFSECLTILKNTTNQYTSEIEYEIIATIEEANAKIKAQEEFINPRISELKRNYIKETKQVSKNLDEELDKLHKSQIKKSKLIKAVQAHIRRCEREAEAQASSARKTLHKRWKNKIKEAQRELSDLQHELKKVEESLKIITREKSIELSKIHSEWEHQVELIRKPIVKLIEERDSKEFALKQESNKLRELEKPIIENINYVFKLIDDISKNFNELYIDGLHIENTKLIFIPIYILGYQTGIKRRYIFVPPSKLNQLEYSTKLKGALGISKKKKFLSPRFKTITNLIENIQLLISQDRDFENELWTQCVQKNVLTDKEFGAKIESGLKKLEYMGWLSSRESIELKEIIRR